MVLSARPANAVAELAAPEPRGLPRLDAVTSQGFTSARERACAALSAGAR